MPELPEVENVVRDLRTSIMGRTITGLMVKTTCVEGILRTPARIFYDSVVLQTVQTVIRRGKYIIMPLSNNNVLVFHLGMTGQLLVSEVEDGDMMDRHLAIEDELAHCHLIFGLRDLGLDTQSGFYASDVELSFCDPRRFGKIWLVENPDNIENLDVPGLKNLGPDALDISIEEFSSLTSKGSRTVKSFLLDQTKLAGVGNIYADEACFVAKVHPARAISSLDRLENAKLWFAVKTVLKEGIKYGGSSISDYTSIKGKKGSYQQKHRVYDKEGVPCVECSTPVQRTKIVGRSTHFCPSCQTMTGDK